MIGEMIQLWRAKRGYSVRRLANIIGISPATLNRIEHGYPMDGRTQLRLMNWAFGKSKTQE